MAQRAVPPFRPPAGAEALSAARAAAEGTTTDGEGGVHFSDDPLGRDRLTFVPSRLRLGSAAWPLPPPEALREAPLTLHLGDLYGGAAAAAALAAAPPAGAPPAAAAPPNTNELRAAAEAWLRADARAAGGALPEARPGEWLLLLQRPSPLGLGLLHGAADCCGQLGRLLDARPSGLGECVLGHALPSVLVAARRGAARREQLPLALRQVLVKVAPPPHTPRPCPLLLTLECLTRRALALSQAFKQSSWSRDAPAQVHRRLVELGLSTSKIPFAFQVEALLMELSTTYN